MILFYYVEDDPDDAFLLAEALEGLGVELEVFQTPFELFERLEEAPLLPALILLDFHTPRMSGMEALMQLKENPEFASIPVAILSTEIQPVCEEQIYRKGCRFYHKPEMMPGYGELASSMVGFAFEVHQGA
jgi:CheY-like chemotaxis protein